MLFCFGAQAKELEVNYWNAWKKLSETNHLETAEWWLIHWLKIFSAETDVGIQNLQNDFRTKALQMNLSDLFRFLPNEESKNRRSFSILGKTIENDRFLIELNRNLPKVESNGGFSIYGSLERTEVRDGILYNLEVLGKLGLGEITPTSWESFFRENLRLLSNDIEIESKKLASLEKNYPKTLSYLRKFMDIEFEVMTIKDKRIIKIFAKLNQEKMKKNYPQMNRYVKNLERLFSVHAKFFEKNEGDPSIIFDFESQKRQMVLQLRIGNNGQLFQDAPIVKLESLIDIDMQFKGIRPQVRRWRHLLTLKRTPQSWNLLAEVHDFPEEIKINSNWLMTIPVWMAKNILSLDQEMDRFFKTLQVHDLYRGMEMEASVHSSSSKKSQMEVRIQFPYNDSFLVQTGFEMIASKINPKPEVIHEMERVREGMLVSILEDLENEYERTKK
jgi:hypothetical protein